MTKTIQTALAALLLTATAHAAPGMMMSDRTGLLMSDRAPTEAAGILIVGKTERAGLMLSDRAGMLVSDRAGLLMSDRAAPPAERTGILMGD